MKKLLLTILVFGVICPLSAQQLRRESSIFTEYFNKSLQLRSRASGIQQWRNEPKKLKALDQQIIALDKKYYKHFVLAYKRHGWLSTKMVGARAAKGFFWLIFNADSTQIKKYLPAASKAVTQKRLAKRHYAQLYDQYQVLVGKPQLYGTSYYWDDKERANYYHEIADIKTVNRRRTIVGLPILETLRTVKLPTHQQTSIGYADVVVDSYYSGANPRFKKLYGGDLGVVADNRAFLREIKLPDAVTNRNKFVSLPSGSYVVVGFGDNSVIDAPGQPDLFIDETGAAGDQAKVYVSADGKKFTFLGIANDASKTVFDLADIGFKKPVVAVKIVGIDSKGAAPGFDLVSVQAVLGAIGDPQPFVPWYMPRRVPDKLKNVLFAFDQWQLSATAKSQINKVVGMLKKHPAISLELIGHTDLVGEHDKNLRLSRKRVEQVYNYMVAQGINGDKLHKKFFGKSKPIYQDQNKQYQALNRRVEFKMK